MIQKYSKDLDYSYTEGFFPTFEMIKFKKDAFRMVYVSTDAVDSDGYQKLKSLTDDCAFASNSGQAFLCKKKELNKPSSSLTV